MRVRFSVAVCCALLAALICAGLALSQATSNQPKKTIAERLGYAANAKLLIIHADDIGLAHSVDVASFDALDRKSVTSGSVMVPCPWLTEVGAYTRQHQDADIGLHVTLTSEWGSYKWGPVASRDRVAGLLDAGGYFPADVPGVMRASAEEVEREIRAQVERAVQAGIHLTHIDTHMGAVAGKPEFAAAYAKVAREYKLPFFAIRMMAASPQMASLVRDNDLVLDGMAMVSPSVKPDQWREAYARIAENLKPGVTQLIVHLGKDDAELQAITAGHPDFGSAWRQRDYDVVSSPEFKQLLKANGVQLIGWKDLKKLIERP